MCEPSEWKTHFMIFWDGSITVILSNFRHGSFHTSGSIPPINAAQVTLWSRLGLTVVQQVLPGDCVRFYCKSSTPAFSSTVSASFFQIIFFFAIRRTTAFLSHRTATRTEDSGHSESADSPKQPQNTETLKIQRDGG